MSASHLNPAVDFVPVVPVQGDAGVGLPALVAEGERALDRGPVGGSGEALAVVPQDPGAVGRVTREYHKKEESL